MANMCDNSIVFTGDAAAIERAKALFREIQAKQEETGKCHLPLFVTSPFSNMQEIVVNEQAIHYQTRWHPNFNGLIQIADHLELDFTMKYDQITDCISGEASYIDKVFNDNRLNRSEDEQQQNSFTR